jgi:hypothetical protein
VGNGLARDGERARIGDDGARDDLDKRGFARAIFAYERVNFARAKIKGNAFERADSFEGFGDGVSSQNEIRFGQSRTPIQAWRVKIHCMRRLRFRAPADECMIFVSGDRMEFRRKRLFYMDFQVNSR